MKLVYVVAELLFIFIMVVSCFIANKIDEKDKMDKRERNNYVLISSAVSAAISVVLTTIGNIMYFLYHRHRSNVFIVPEQSIQHMYTVRQIVDGLH